MKKIITLAIIVCIVFACSRKTVVTSTTATTPTPVESEHATMLASGKTIYTTRCTKCHGAKEASAYTEERWDNILRSMIPKAKLTEEEAKQVTAYVKANAKK